MSKRKKPAVRDCIGCVDNFYNHTPMGANELTGRPECWSFETATLVKAKDVPIDLRPPYKHLPLTMRPNCYHRKGYVRIPADALDAQGYRRNSW